MKTLAMLSMIALAACGGDDGGGTGRAMDAPAGNACTTVVASCQFHQNPMSCQEVHSGISLSTYQQVCTDNGGTYAAQPCSRTGSVGGCQDASLPGCMTAWYYAPQTADQIRLSCTNSGGVFLSP